MQNSSGDMESPWKIPQFIGMSAISMLLHVRVVFQFYTDSWIRLSTDGVILYILLFQVSMNVELSYRPFGNQFMPL